MYFSMHANQTGIVANIVAIPLQSTLRNFRLQYAVTSKLDPGKRPRPWLRRDCGKETLDWRRKALL